MDPIFLAELAAIDAATVVRLNPLGERVLHQTVEGALSCASGGRYRKDEIPAIEAALARDGVWTGSLCTIYPARFAPGRRVRAELRLERLGEEERARVRAETLDYIARECADASGIRSQRPGK